MKKIAKLAADKKLKQEGELLRRRDKERRMALEQAALEEDEEHQLACKQAEVKLEADKTLRVEEEEHRIATEQAAVEERRTLELEEGHLVACELAADERRREAETLEQLQKQTHLIAISQQRILDEAVRKQPASLLNPFTSSWTPKESTLAVQAIGVIDKAPPDINLINPWPSPPPSIYSKYAELEKRMAIELAVRDTENAALKKQLAGHITSSNNSSSDINECVICLDAKPTILLLPCKHLCLCSKCYSEDNTSQCPICVGEVESMMNIFPT